MSKNFFIDTNIILRFLLKDNKSQHKVAEKIFKKAEKKKIMIWTTDVVILETIWTLSSFYRYSKKTIRKSVESLFSLKNFDVLNKQMLLQAVHDFDFKNVDFADAYNYQLALKHKKEILSFDKDMKKLSGKNTNPTKIVT